MSFRVDLDVFRGPLDLLLYLVRKHEVEITDIPITLITEQYLTHMEVLEQIDVNAVGDFVDMASRLIEIKSQMVLPHGDEEQGEIEDPRQDLVQRLLEYKKYRDAASILEEQSREWQQRFARVANDLPPRERNMATEPISEVELWDLVSAFGRILRDNQAQRPSNIVYDDTPIHVYMERITEMLEAKGQLVLSELFTPEMHKSTQISLFLAVLELVRHFHVRTDQNTLFGDVRIFSAERKNEPLDLSSVESYEHGGGQAEAS